MHTYMWTFIYDNWNMTIDVQPLQSEIPNQNTEISKFKYEIWELNTESLFMKSPTELLKLKGNKTSQMKTAISNTNLEHKKWTMKHGI